MTTLSTHVLDTSLGKPAQGISIELRHLENDMPVQRAITDSDGRVSSELFAPLLPGTYQLRFHTQGYLTERHGSAFYPYVDVCFTLQAEQESSEHYHVPLLLSPFGFSSYRGS